MVLSEKKRVYGQKLVELVEDSRSILIVEADNVGSRQMQQIRLGLRGVASVLMGKNTTMRKVINDFLKKNPEHPIRSVLDHIFGNIGFVFTSGELNKVRDMIQSNKVPAPARVGAVAPSDVFVEPGPTGCDPGQTQWFQALNIPTKINKGQIEMISRVHLIKEGDRVTESQSALLQKLSIKPFSYGLKVTKVYDNGEVFEASILDISEKDLISKLATGIAHVAAVGIEVGLPNKASIVHSINNAFKALISIAIGTDYKFAKAAPFEEFLKNPGAFASAAPAAAASGSAPAAAAAAKESSSEESVAGGAGGLFGGDDDW